MLDKIVRSVNELNAAAESLRQSGGTEELKKLARAWNVPYAQTEDYIKGKRYRLMEVPVSDKEFRTHSEKLREEMLVLDDKYFASIIAWHMIQKCEEDGELGKMVLKKHKSLQRCMDFITGRAFEAATEQAKQKGREGVQRNTGFALTENEVFPWAEEYYQSSDEDAVKKNEAEEKEKIQKEWERREGVAKVAASGTKKASPKAKKGTKKKETDKPGKAAGNSAAAGTKKAAGAGTSGQLSLFDLAG